MEWIDTLNIILIQEKLYCITHYQQFYYDETSMELYTKNKKLLVLPSDRAQAQL